MPASTWRTVAGRALAAVAAVAAALSLVALTTGSWATATFSGSTARGGADPNRHMELEMFPDGRLVAHHSDTSLRQLYEAGENAPLRSALGHAVPGTLNGFAIACVVVVGLVAVVGVFRRLPSFLWTVATAVGVGALTAAAVLRFEVTSALATVTAQMNISPVEVHDRPVAGWTTTALAVFLVAAAASALPVLHEPSG